MAIATVGEIRLVRVRLEGISPLLMNAMPEEKIITDLIKGQRAPIDKSEDLDVKAAKCLYKQDGVIGLPSDNLFSACVVAGSHVKYEGKRMVSNSSSSLLASIFSIKERFCPITPDKWKRDIRRGMLPSGVACGIVRPMFEKWGIDVTLELYLDPPATEGMAQAVLEKAGRLVGLCDFRPARKGQFGRFRIASWEKITETK